MTIDGIESPEEQEASLDFQAKQARKNAVDTVRNIKEQNPDCTENDIAEPIEGCINIIRELAEQRPGLDSNFWGEYQTTLLYRDVKAASGLYGQRYDYFLNDEEAGLWLQVVNLPTEEMIAKWHEQLIKDFTEADTDSV